MDKQVQQRHSKSDKAHRRSALVKVMQSTSAEVMKQLRSCAKCGEKNSACFLGIRKRSHSILCYSIN